MTLHYKTRRSINKFGVAEWNLSITVRNDVKRKGGGWARIGEGCLEVFKIKTSFNPYLLKQLKQPAEGGIPAGKPKKVTL